MKATSLVVQVETSTACTARPQAAADKVVGLTALPDAPAVRESGTLSGAARSTGSAPHAIELAVLLPGAADAKTTTVPEGVASETRTDADPGQGPVTDNWGAPWATCGAVNAIKSM
jgi:hypothetical protein